MTVMVVIGLVLALLVGAVVRALRAKPLLGPASMVGSVGVARTDIAPEGWVLARGARWRARTGGAPIPMGSRVVVRSVSGLLLMVEAPELAPGGTPRARRGGIRPINERRDRPDAEEADLGRTA